MAEQLDRHLYDVWPRGTRAERAMYQKLKDAYRKARYSRHYKISREELDWLSGRVEILGQRVHEICSARIAALEAEAKARSEEHTSELQSLMRISYAVFCLKKQ